MDSISMDLWDGKLLSHHLSLKYNIDLGTRQCQRIIRKLGFSLRKPMPKIAKGDASEKEKLKKTPESPEEWKIHCLY